MFVRLAAIALVTSSFLSGVVAEPIPVPTPAPVPVEPRGVLDILTSIISVGASLGEITFPGVEDIWHQPSSITHSERRGRYL